MIRTFCLLIFQENVVSYCSLSLTFYALPALLSTSSFLARRTEDLRNHCIFVSLTRLKYRLPASFVPVSFQCVLFRFFTVYYSCCFLSHSRHLPFFQVSFHDSYLLLLLCWKTLLGLIQWLYSMFNYLFATFLTSSYDNQLNHELDSFWHSFVVSSAHTESRRCPSLHD